MSITPEHREAAAKACDRVSRSDLATQLRNHVHDTSSTSLLMFSVFDAGRAHGSVVDNRPGIADKVAPDLMSKRVQDW